jgi:uncharacterized protein (TIGR04222 family)
MNPFDLRGPEFLAFYLAILAVSVLAALAVRWSLRPPADDRPEETPDLSPYDVVYLAGGDQLAVTAAIASLVHRNVLEVDGPGRKLRIQQSMPPKAHTLERAVFVGVASAQGEAINQVQARALPRAAKLRPGLQEAGLVLSEEAAWTCRLLSALPLFAVALVGLVKIVVGTSRGKPVGYLVLLVILTVVAGVFLLAKRPLRSRRGDGVLARLKTANEALGLSARRAPDWLEHDDLVLALGLFGTTILAYGTLAPLQVALKPPPSAGGSGCGGGGCGGGCGGGGCGGCGG